MKLQLALTLALASLVAHATNTPTKDGKGLQDPPGLSRYTGSILFAADRVDYDEIKAAAARVEYFADGSPGFTSAKFAEASGQRWRLHYQLPDGRSPLEVLRNYQQQLKEKGFTTLFDCAGEACGRGADDYSRGVIGMIYPPDDLAKLQADSEVRCTGAAFMSDVRYAVLKNETSGELLALAMHRPGDVSIYCPPAEWKKHIYATVVYVKPKAMELQMETIAASVMEKTITETGRIALYGILFDTASAAVKAESKSSLDEIGKLMKADAKLKLRIVGHTDSQGAFDANMDLSKRRAEAVKAALVKDYGVAAIRLIANGAASLAPVATNTSDDGRSKNRRVELVPF